MKLEMRTQSLYLVLLLVVACGGDDGFEGDAVLLDDASDEVLVTLEDAVDRGLVSINDQLSAQLVMPGDGAQVPTGSPPTFSWAPPQITAVHGRTTGDFVWLRIECADMEPIDVLAIETMEYTPDVAHWTKITDSSGTCTSTLTTAFLDRGILTEGGPYRPSVNPTFTTAD